MMLVPCSLDSIPAKMNWISWAICDRNNKLRILLAMLFLILIFRNIFVILYRFDCLIRIAFLSYLKFSFQSGKRVGESTNYVTVVIHVNFVAKILRLRWQTSHVQMNLRPFVITFLALSRSFFSQYNHSWIWLETR